MNYTGIFKRVFFFRLSITIFILSFIIILIQNFAWSWGRPFGMQFITYIPQEIIIQYKYEATSNDIGYTYNNLGLYEIGYNQYSGLRRVKIPPNSSVYTVSAALNKNPSVSYAEPNFLRIPDFVPNDPLYRYQWHLNNPMMQQTWDISVGSNIVVAVLDSGIAYRNGGGFAQAPDLANTNFIPGYDFVNNDKYPDDDNRHGTHIAGIIAQSTNNSFGGCGVAPACTIMPVKVLDKTGSGNVADIVEAIYFAVNNGADIINMSYGFVTSPSQSEEEAINYAVSYGVTIVCSAGNEATNEPHYPSSYEATICVTATKYDHSFAYSYSNYGPDVDICAPGGDINDDLNNDGYPDGIYQQTHDGIDYKSFDFYFAEGTSCSSAFVSGVVALILARASKPLTPADIKQILQLTATDMGEPGWDQFYGWGLINPLGAVQASISYSAASAAGYFVPGINYQQGNPYNTVSNITNRFNNNIITTPSQVPVSNSTYRINSGFTSIGQNLGTNLQLLNTQAILPYQTQGVVEPNILLPSINNNLLLGSFLPAPYLLTPYSLPNPYQWPQQFPVINAVNNNASYLVSSSNYQSEAVFLHSYIPYQAQQWSNPGAISPFTSSSILTKFNYYPFWLY